MGKLERHFSTKIKGYSLFWSKFNMSAEPAPTETPAVEETKAEDTAISQPVADAAEAAESEKAANLVQNKVRVSSGRGVDKCSIGGYC